MEIIIRKSHKRPQRKVLNAIERSMLLNRKRNFEAMLRLNQPVDVGGRFYVKPPQDKDAIRRELRNINRTLENKNPRDYSVQQKNELYSVAKKLREKILDGMPTKEELKVATPENIQKQVKWMKEKEKYVKAYKNIMRTLDKDDPFVGSIERIRPKK